MFCKKCGRELEEHAKFCDACGTMVQNTKKMEKKRSLKKKWVPLGILFLCFLLGGSVFGYGVIQEKLEEKRRLSQMKQWGDDIEEAKKQYDTCVPDEYEKEEFEHYLEEYTRIGKEVDNYFLLKKLQQEVLDCKEKIQNRNKRELQEEEKCLLEEPLTYANQTELKQIENYKKTLQEQIQKGDFIGGYKTKEKWKDLSYDTSNVKDGLYIDLLQSDYSDYPKVKLYFDIQDEDGNRSNNISEQNFFLSEKGSEDTEFQLQKITKAVQLNEKEALSIDLVVDTSGSMEGQNLQDAKRFMKQFLAQVQFQVGDTVKITPFNSVIYKETTFMNKADNFYTLIDQLQAEGETKLYDTLVYAVQDVSHQKGAGCVIAFTDGEDLGSFYEYQDVIDIANQHHIPIYIVQVGVSSDSGLLEICSETGGEFFHADNFGEEVANIYNQIYRKIKECYVVEYELPNNSSISEERQFELYVRTGENGGTYNDSYVAENDVFGTLVWDYLNAYIYDMNHHKYDRLKQYIAENTEKNDKNNLYTQMTKQVSGGYGDILEEGLIDVQIEQIEKVNDDFYLISTYEKYDVIKRETYGEIVKKYETGSGISRSAAEQTLDKLGGGSYQAKDKIKIWKATHQKAVYEVKRTKEGTWKFYRYHIPLNYTFCDPTVYWAEKEK